MSLAPFRGGKCNHKLHWCDDFVSGKKLVNESHLSFFCVLINSYTDTEFYIHLYLGRNELWLSQTERFGSRLVVYLIAINKHAWTYPCMFLHGSTWIHAIGLILGDSTMDMLACGSLLLLNPDKRESMLPNHPSTITIEDAREAWVCNDNLVYLL